MIVTTSISLTDYNSILLKTIIKYFVAHVNHEKHSGAENLGIGLDVKGNGMPVVHYTQNRFSDYDVKKPDPLKGQHGDAYWDLNLSWWLV